jgi:hypothetical protein
MTELAVYTTAYPGVEPYLADWYRSVLSQSDRDFRLWIGVDSITVDAVEATVGSIPEAVWVQATPMSTPAQVRQQAIGQMVETCDAVVFVDSDDVLCPTRVASARAQLAESDLTGCALQLIDEKGVDLGLTFGLPEITRPEEVLPRNNVFGLSNTAFRSDLLRACLPIPSDTLAVDWFLATRAWLRGASMSFGNHIEMLYRQHPSNTVRTTGPFDAEQVARDTERVRRHFELVREAGLEDGLTERVSALQEVAGDVELFQERIVSDCSLLEEYVSRLNSLHIAPLWWSSVANPALQTMWSQPEEKR